jgi:hypothetical protein
MAARVNSCIRLVDFQKIFSEAALPNWTDIWWEASMEGSVLSFLKGEWQVNDAGSALLTSSLEIGYLITL